MILLSISQLCLLRSLRKAGFPCELIGIFLLRCGASEEEWKSLAGLVEERQGRYWLTEQGQKLYRLESKGRYF